ncbi:Crp/Fnr family transcriptional regulator [Hydrogenivirga sp.]
MFTTDESGAAAELVGEVFPDSSEEFKSLLLQNGSLASFKKGSVLYYPGETCGAVPIVLSGQVKVYITSEEGREVLLYTVSRGETCMLTNLSVLKDKPYPAYALASVDSSIFLIPDRVAKNLFERFSPWREFVLDAFVKDGWSLAFHMSEVISRRVDKRLAEYLLRLSHPSGVLRVTHEEVARDLGTVREVVTRILKKFETQGFIVVGRKEIRVVDREGLKNFVSVT